MSAPRGKPPLPVKVDSRAYTIFGQKYPRVTSIVGCIPKPALVGWAAKSVAKFAVAHRSEWEKLPPEDATKLLKGAPWSERDAAADRGTVIHKIVESYLRGEPMPECTEEELDVAIAAERFLLDHKPEVFATEVTVYSRELCYAGTLDLWCNIGGANWLLDWKSGKGVYGEYAVQLAAYGVAERALLNGDDVPWRPAGEANRLRLGVVHLGDNGYTLYEVMQPVDELKIVLRSLVVIHGWMKIADDALLPNGALALEVPA